MSKAQPSAPAFEAAGIPCVLLKGRAFSDLHPEPRHADHWHEGP
jgi:hypothetical protein